MGKQKEAQSCSRCGVSIGGWKPVFTISEHVEFIDLVKLHGLTKVFCVIMLICLCISKLAQEMMKEELGLSFFIYNRTQTSERNSVSSQWIDVKMSKHCSASKLSPIYFINKTTVFK